MPEQLMSDSVTELNHRCRTKDNCVAKTSDGAAVTPKPNTVCTGCVRRLQTHLEQLPHLRDALESFKAPSMVSAHGSKVNSTPTPSAPVDLRVLDLIGEITDTLALVGGPTIRVGDLITKPSESVRVWRHGRFTDRPLDGVDRALTIGVVWRKVNDIVGLSRTWVRRQAPCPRCGLRTLGMWSGEDSVHCTNSSCGKSFPLSDYERFCLAKVEIEKTQKKGTE